MATDSLFTSRFSVSERRATLVGRAAEMRELEQSFALARDRGEARAVTIVGAAGIGKTRLCREFLVRVQDGGRPPRVLRGGAREGGPAYEVLARLLRARFGIVEGLDPDVARAQVRSHLSAVLDDRKVGDVAYFLGQILDLAFQGSPLVRAVEADPQQVRTTRRAVLRSFLELDARKGDPPLVLVLDDLHWAHDDSLDLLAALLDMLHAPILFVCVARSELLARREAWTRHGGDRHRLVELAPLGDGDAAAVMRDLLSPCGDASDVEALVDEAVEVAAGNPALLEQIVRVFHEAGVLEPAGGFDEERWTIHGDKLAGVKLPLTVQDAVQARIAALAPDERELLERAAAMGGVFWLGGLVAIARRDASAPDVWDGDDAADVGAIRQGLAELVERDYVLRLPDSALAGDEEYVFKHNLEREALERLTPPAAARRYHHAIADWLSFREAADGSEEYLEMLARHRDRAGASALAAASYVKAGDVARGRAAYSKAAELYGKALGLVRQRDRAGDYADEELRLRALHHTGDVLQLLGRNDEALRAFEEMLSRAWQLDLRSKGGAAHARIGRLARETGDLDAAARNLTAALALYGQARDERGLGSTLDDIGKLHWIRCDYPLALEYTLRGLAMRRKLGDRRSVALSLNNLGLVQQDSGNTRAALEAFEQALRIRREIGDLVGVSTTLNNLGTVAQDMRDDKKALALFQEAYDVAKQTGDRRRISLILTNLGESHDRLGDSARAAASLQQAQDVAEELGDRLALAEAARGLGKTYLSQRDYARARERMQRAADLFAEVGAKLKLGVALRSLGEIAAAASTGGGTGLLAATEHLRRSIAIFEELGNQAELAKSCRTFSELLRQVPEYSTNAAVAAEAQLMARRADDIVAKAKAEAAAKERQRDEEKEIPSPHVQAAPRPGSNPPRD